MNLKTYFNSEEQNLLSDAGITVKNREYSKEELSLCESQIMDYIMSKSKNAIESTKMQYDSILRAIDNN